VSEIFFVENQIVHIPHPCYSPDLAPSDFWLFGHMKAGLAGQSFAEPEGLFEGIMAGAGGGSSIRIEAGFPPLRGTDSMGAG
jgi:hypothetical protein